MTTTTRYSHRTYIDMGEFLDEDMDFSEATVEELEELADRAIAAGFTL